MTAVQSHKHETFFFSRSTALLKVFLLSGLVTVNDCICVKWELHHLVNIVCALYIHCLTQKYHVFLQIKGMRVGKYIALWIVNTLIGYLGKKR